MPGFFDPPYIQRALLEIVLLSVTAGALGTWVVMRGLSFYAHAVGTAAFPGLVLADGVGFAPLLGAAGSAALVAALVGVLARRRAESYDSLTALALVGALAAGVLLASDVYHSQGDVERLLFGSLLLINGTDQVLAAVLAAVVVVAGALVGRRWLATGFDADGARAIGVRSALPDWLLLALTAAAAVVALDAIGALLAAAMLVMPAATARLLSNRVGRWQLTATAVALVQGVFGLWLSIELDAPPGATIAVVGGGLLLIVAVSRRVPVMAVGGVLSLAVIAGGCGSDGSSGAGTGANGSGPIKVVATTTQLGDIVREVGGPAVEVKQILQPNSDPHDYEPRPSDVSATSGADLVVESGDNLDQWMGEVIDNAGGDPTVLDAGAGRPDKRPGESSGAEASTYDPHWWHDPTNVEYAVDRIRDALTRADPTQRAAITKRAAAYNAKVARLDTGIRACMAVVPAAQRKLVTDHDAFGYFAARYGITIVGAVIPSQTTQAQPSAGDLQKLADVIRREHVNAVFPESSVNPKLAQAIARETGATADHTLYGDTLGPAGSPGASYLDMELANADAMVKGFTDGAHGCSISGI